MEKNIDFLFVSIPAHVVPYVQLAVPLLVCILLVCFLLRYLKEYRFPAKKMQRMLAELTIEINKVSALPSGARKSELAKIFSTTSLQHTWSEYQETLHDQMQDVEGEYRVIRTRSTVPASFYFAESNIIDTPLRTEYFKHLPGILTGIGIVGTFLGLLVGLSAFDPTDPTKIQGSVTLLLGGVRDAFLASFLAIAMAMYVTNSEKKNLRICYAKLEELTEAIDHLFDSGVGEEYLASLVRSSEESAKQAKMLKDSLVTDLREMLQNIVDSQVRENMRLADSLGSVYRESGQNMAATISQSIEHSFKDPLTKIADSVQAASGDQSERVHSLLQDVLVTFMQKLESTFGQQFSGMQGMMQQSVQSMQQMQQSFNGLIDQMQNASTEGSRQVREELAKTLADMQSSQSVMQASMNEMIASLQKAVSGIGEQGASAGAEMAEQMRKLFAENETRQQQMAEQFHQFVDGLKSSVGSAHQETMTKMAATVDTLGSQLQGVMQTLEQSRDGMDQTAHAAQEQLRNESIAMLESFGQRIDGLLAAMDTQHSQSQTTIEQLAQATASSLEGMKAGADKMRTAAEVFGAAASAAQRMSEASGAAADKMQQGAQGVSSAIQGLSEQIAEYRNQREAVQKMMATLETVIAQSRLDAQSRNQMQAELQTIFESMQRVNRESSEFLDKAEGILSKSFNTFGDGVVKSLNQSLGSMDAELDKAVKALAGGVEELNDSVESIAEVLGKRLVK
ncbi:type I Zorya anti-phage system protein ZorA1 [Chitinilyticum aquatile]|uniref:type I Zorya anti-phage system protein ZorA1 n=1 Tax=Chitinilyticum aquatile TaxID=362520 RepID=UPI0004227241|nr:type I Zorya anti-phage system protein ZorA1 [Chitinilyticum aquatile]